MAPSNYNRGYLLAKDTDPVNGEYPTFAFYFESANYIELAFTTKVKGSETGDPDADQHIWLCIHEHPQDPDNIDLREFHGRNFRIYVGDYNEVKNKLDYMLRHDDLN